MKINKNQALYKALPNTWTTYSNSTDYKFTCRVSAWNTKKVDGINEITIKKDIVRRVKSFKNAGGICGDEFSDDAIMKLEFVEPALNNGIPDIVVNINPTVFYCPTCYSVKNRIGATSLPYCGKCIPQKKMNQLQMVYVCDCGYADGVSVYREDLLYKYKIEQFKFFDQNGKKVEMEIKCPQCGKFIHPRNATDEKAIFYAQSGNTVNLYNKKYGQLLEQYGKEAELLMLAKWFNIISNETYLEILSSPKNFFDTTVKEAILEKAKRMAEGMHVSLEIVLAYLNADEKESIDSLKSKLMRLIQYDYMDNDTLQLITYDLMEYDTLRYPKGITTISNAIEKNIEVGAITDENDILVLLDKMHIKNMQISEQVQIVNYAYGYTRLYNSPIVRGEQKTNSLRIRGFDNKVFTTVLETEGLLVEIDMLYVYNWLKFNDIIDGDEEIDDIDKAKKWFIENIKLDAISQFSTINTKDNKITKAVYSLLHTISHMMIRSAGKHSGLSSDSLSELIFANTCSFFIYPTSSEGVTLGSISGMFESELELFLEDSYKDNEICTFDPICLNNQNGACLACTYLSDVNCTHFNQELSRAYLYGGTIKDGVPPININKGFWK